MRVDYNRDSEVEKELRYLGWKDTHFGRKEIKKNPKECVQVIQEAIFMICMTRVNCNRKA